MKLVQLENSNNAFNGVPFNDTIESFFDTYKVDEDIECYQLLFCPYGTGTSFDDLNKIKFQSRVVILNIIDEVINEDGSFAIEELTKFCLDHPEQNFIIFNFQLNIKDQLKLDNLYTDTIQSSNFKGNFKRCEKKDITNRWLLLNSGSKIHRILTICYLLSKDYYLNGDITFDMETRLGDWDRKDMSKMSNEFRNKFMKGYERFKSNQFTLLNLTKYTDTETVVNNYNINLLPVYENVGVEIITATSFFEKTPGLSEKEFQSVYGKTFPIYIGGVGSAREIKKFFNLDTFDDIIDHSYDTIEDHYERLSTAIEKNEKLLDGSTNIKELWFDNQKRFEENCNKVDSMLHDKEYQKMHNDNKIKKALTHFNCSFKETL